MAVYVDDYDFPYRGMLMSHMVADTTKELLTMVDKINVKRKWIQYPGTPNEHFDICVSKKKLALKFGAKQITAMQYAEFVNKRRPKKDRYPASWYKNNKK